MVSSMFRAGEILLLVGAIMSAASVLLFLVMAGVMGAVTGFAWMGIMYGVLGLLAGAGAAFGFVAYSRARAGDAQRAFTMGLVASLLPPLQVLLLIGAILCKVSPEATGGAQAVAPA